MIEDSRVPERLRFHYDVERELASKLRSASRDQRRTLYKICYDELFARVPDHPQLTRRQADDQHQIRWHLKLLQSMIGASETYLEIGAGDCRLAFAMCARVGQCYALDVSNLIPTGLEAPPNFQLVLSDGISIPIPAASVDLAYSNQVIEHVHPDDVEEHLAGIFLSLKRNGRYLCITPNKVLGPHDVSKYFGNVPEGLHLREYTHRELYGIFKRSGFRRLRSLILHGGEVLASLPLPPARALERVCEFLPPSCSRLVTHNRFVRPFLGIALLAER